MYNTVLPWFLCRLRCTNSQALPWSELTARSLSSTAPAVMETYWSSLPGIEPGTLPTRVKYTVPHFANIPITAWIALQLHVKTAKYSQTKIFAPFLCIGVKSYPNYQMKPRKVLLLAHALLLVIPKAWFSTHFCVFLYTIQTMIVFFFDTHCSFIIWHVYFGSLIVWPYGQPDINLNCWNHYITPISASEMPIHALFTSLYSKVKQNC